MDKDVLMHWKKDWALMKDFFDPGEIDTITQKLENMEPRNLVFCAFENRFALSGGLGTVTKTILPHLNELQDVQRVLLMTPYYSRITAGKKVRPQATGISFDVIFDDETIGATLLKHTQPALSPGRPEVEEYYIGAPGFFDADNDIGDPYSYKPGSPWENDEIIRRNVLFYCRAVPYAMAALGIEEDIVFHLQDWHTVLTALTAKEAMLEGTLVSAGCAPTIHNAFDSWISAETMAVLTGRLGVLRNPHFKANKGLTALQIGLQLADAPITTVSDHFAEELTTDLLQAGHFAPHLQDILKKGGVYGNNNGLFISFPPEYGKKENYSIQEIKKVKLTQRKKLLDILDTYHPGERFGRLSYKDGPITSLPPDVPILVMSGRLDPFQKGFDILLQAVEYFKQDEIKVVVSPLPVKPSDLDYFHEIASKCRGNLTVFPIRMEKGYRELQMGGTFAVMPSIYEPFGAAIEFMVSGTVTIARRTGGLVNQIQHTHCGFLFNETPRTYTMENIRCFAESTEIVQCRKRNPWARDMARELARTIREAADVFVHQPDEYYRMIEEGLLQAQAFTWKEAAANYYRAFKKIKCRDCHPDVA